MYIYMYNRDFHIELSFEEVDKKSAFLSRPSTMAFVVERNPLFTKSIVLTGINYSH